VSEKTYTNQIELAELLKCRFHSLPDADMGPGKGDHIPKITNSKVNICCPLSATHNALGLDYEEHKFAGLG
jgi:hypothetical protein